MERFTACLTSTRFWLIGLLLLSLILLGVRLSGPTDLEGYAQPRNVGYLLDLLGHGNWLAQVDLRGRILSKPPLHTWAMALFAGPFGMQRWTLVMPSFLAVTGLALLVMMVGQRAFGPLAGGLAGLAVILAPLVSKHLALVRSDAMFALAIAAAAITAWRAWESGKGWT